MFVLILKEMSHNKINRRLFIRNTALAATALTLTGERAFSATPSLNKNMLPRWKGFNLLDYFSPSVPRNPEAGRTTGDDFKWMTDWGFDFVRIPMAYPRYLSFDRTKDITKDEIYKTDSKVLDEIDKLIFKAHKYGLHVSLNQLLVIIISVF